MNWATQAPLSLINLVEIWVGGTKVKFKSSPSKHKKTKETHKMAKVSDMETKENI